MTSDFSVVKMEFCFAGAKIVLCYCTKPPKTTAKKPPPVYSTAGGTEGNFCHISGFFIITRDESWIAYSALFTVG